jgi:5-methylcytosine-specific restriction endonuclease McrA
LNLHPDSFGPSKKEGRKGYAHWCKPCRASYQREKRGLTKKEAIRRYKKFPVARTCTKCESLCSASDFYKAEDSWCKTCDNVFSRQWRSENKEEFQTLVRTWQMENPEKVADATRRRNQRMVNNGIFKISKRDIARIYRSDCFFCGSKDSLTLDHIIPIARGGRHSIGNLIGLCRSCNSKKGKKMWIEFTACAV